MRLWHSAAATSVQFDESNLVSCAGLVPVMRLGQDCGLAELVAEHLRVAGPLGANTPFKVGGVVAGMLMCFGWNLGAFAEPVFLGSVAEQRAIAWTMYQRGIINFDFGLASSMGVILMIIAFVVTYFSLRYSRGALVD